MSPAPAYAGVRVLDLTRVLAGPYATMLLADLGAQVVKVETPGRGDDSRSFTPPGRDGESAYFLSTNRNKLSVAIDLKHPEGRALLLDLAAGSDVMIENYRTGVVERLGIDYDAVRARNPGIIYCSVSGYGRDGSHAGYPGYDPVTQAESGLMSMSGEPDGPPVRVGVSVIDMVTGMHAAQAISAALYHRRAGGEGQRIEVSLYDTGLNMLVNFGAAYLLTGECPHRAGNGTQVAQPAGNFRTRDGQVMITVANDRMFRALCEQVMERPELADDPRFATNPDRLRNRPALDSEVERAFAPHTRAELMRRLRAAGIPAGEIRSVAEALDAPLTHEREMVRDVEHTALGPIRAIASPMRLEHTPVVEPVAAPVLGEHTEQVLRDMLGVDAARIRALAEAGVIHLA